MIKPGQVWKRSWELSPYEIKVTQVTHWNVFYTFHSEEIKPWEPIHSFLDRFYKVSVEQTVMDI